MIFQFTNLLTKHNRLCSLQRLVSYSKKEIPRNELENIISSNKQEENGVVYEKRPFRMKLEAGKNYSWCLCGRSKSQPLCDGTHRDTFLKIKQRPVRFQVKDTKEYWLCNCKQTKNRPFCDGAHKTKAVQEAIAIIKS